MAYLGTISDYQKAAKSWLIGGGFPSKISPPSMSDYGTDFTGTPPTPRTTTPTSGTPTTPTSPGSTSDLMSTIMQNIQGVQETEESRYQAGLAPYKEASEYYKPGGQFSQNAPQQYYQAAIKPMVGGTGGALRNLFSTGKAGKISMQAARDVELTRGDRYNQALAALGGATQRYPLMPDYSGAVGLTQASTSLEETKLNIASREKLQQQQWDLQEKLAKQELDYNTYKDMMDRMYKQMGYG